MIKIIKITKDEAMELASKGVKYGENGISMSSRSHKKHYYLCERYKNLKLLREYRERITK